MTVSCSGRRVHSTLRAAALLWLAAAAWACSERPAAAPAGAPQTRVARAAVTLCGGEQTCVATDAHARHQANGLDCVSCHPCGGQFGFRTGYAFPGGTTIQPTDAYTPPSGTTPASCTVACHYPMGSPPAPVRWSAPAPLACVGCHDVPTLLARFPNHPSVPATATRGDCEACHQMTQHTSGTVLLQRHPTTWMVRTDPGFHAASAIRGLGSCQACHLRDLSGGRTGVACTDCHRAGGSANDFATCTACHGGVLNQTGAPPAAIWGFAGDPNRGGGTADPVRVGAHAAHVTEGQFGPAFPCSSCHLTPPNDAYLSAGHIDDLAPGAIPQAEVVFGGLSVNGSVSPQWNRGSATCSATYCHGATLDLGGSTPVWTGGAGQVFCGSCHGVPPATPHIRVDTSGGLGACSPCHSFTVDGAGQLIPASQGGRHLNGLLEASGHDAAWMDRTSPGFHAFAANRGIQNCTACHGTDLTGGSVRVGCTDCHRAGGVANDFASCTACHGGAANQTGAPPAAIWGYAGDPNRGGGTADPIRVGAHTRHVQAQLTAPIDCAACHVKPTSVLSAGHIDDPTPVASVSFHGLAAQVPPGPGPSWSRATAGCSATYCHGNYAGSYTYFTYDWGNDVYVQQTVAYAGARATPTWTDGPMTCASCHGNPPRGTGNWHSGFHGYQTGGYNDCQLCHPDASGANGVGTSITNPALHLNGVIDVQPQWGNRCFGCH
ncbi:MAG: CxxxxCH/CxxCH domain-containing protein [Deltaproteobacteria bacterium]|nr:CxxxxCH/CxxCH domain-containing protein [Deltaproteobacteria bacterium]